MLRAHIHTEGVHCRANVVQIFRRPRGIRDIELLDHRRIDHRREGGDDAHRHHSLDERESALVDRSPRHHGRTSNRACLWTPPGVIPLWHKTIEDAKRGRHQRRRTRVRYRMGLT
jgi:hypothetical protein